jgi:hypothetical protein
LVNIAKLDELYTRIVRYIQPLNGSEYLEDHKKALALIHKAIKTILTREPLRTMKDYYETFEAIWNLGIVTDRIALHIANEYYEDVDEYIKWVNDYKYAVFTELVKQYTKSYFPQR